MFVQKNEKEYLEMVQMLRRKRKMFVLHGIQFFGACFVYIGKMSKKSTLASLNGILLEFTLIEIDFYYRCPVKHDSCAKGFQLRPFFLVRLFDHFDEF